MDGPPLSGPRYDPNGSGGTTTVTFDLKNGRWIDTRPSLSGTFKNCAGGVTPWGSWLTCEETLAGPEVSDADDTHGWVFEVPADGFAVPKPLRDLGRFKHEAAAVHPQTGAVYLTEDERSAGLYKMRPKEPGNLAAGGDLMMLAVLNEPRKDMSWVTTEPGEWLSVVWVPIDDPTNVKVDGAPKKRGVYWQGHEGGGAEFKRLEGCWLEGDSLFFTSTTGGFNGDGQIWELDTRVDRLRVLYTSPGGDVLKNPDNLVSVGNGLLLCEDRGSIPSRMVMLTGSGQTFTVAQNTMNLKGVKGFEGDYRTSEWAGVCTASGHGRDWVFANLQLPGVTLAITGPWQELA